MTETYTTLKTATPQELYYAAHWHHKQYAPPEFMRGLKRGFDTALDGARVALGSGLDEAKLVAGIKAGVALAGPEGWENVAPHWLTMWKAENERIE